MEEKQHELKQIRIDRTNIEKFKKMRTARPLKENHVRSIEKLLRKGGHFISPMAINRMSYGEYRVIDGHHRLEAIGRVLKDIPDYSILTDFQIFYNLSEEEERKIFASESVGLKQTLLSRLYVEQEDYPIVKMLLSDFPIKIDYGQMHSNDRTYPWISLITLLTAHSTLHKSITTINLHRGHDSMKKVALMTESDYKTMIKFGEDVAIMGNGRFGPRTIFISVTMVLIYRLWYLNCIERPFMVSESISRQKFVERFVKVLNNWPTVSDAFHEANKVNFGSILVVKAEEDLVNKMNHGRKTQKVIPTYEAWK